MQAQAGQAHEAAAGDRWRAQRYQHAYDDLGRLRRRGQAGRQLKDSADQFAARAEEQHAHDDRFDQHARTLASGPEG